MTNEEHTARCMAAAQLLKAHGFEDIAGELAALELKGRRASKGQRKRKARLATADGRPVAGGAVWIDAAKIHDAVVDWDAEEK